MLLLLLPDLEKHSYHHIVHARGISTEWILPGLEGRNHYLNDYVLKYCPDPLEPQMDYIVVGGSNAFIFPSEILVQPEFQCVS